ncbi:sigma-70 family RNA polymerase sigma factor [Leucothrix sargassi]|nr:sigma-70 family RNA polymerase sigma factor [Leucothrix sargassi]
MTTEQIKFQTMLVKISTGDKRAFDQFYDATIKLTFSCVLRITANKQLAEEVVSDVYMQVWQTADKYNAGVGAPLAWLTMIARSRAIDMLRREKSATRKQMPLIDGYDAVDEEEPCPMTEAITVEKRRKLKNLLCVLGQTERQMIILAFYKGMTHSEIAVHMGKPLGSVKTTLRRAQKGLRSAFVKSMPLQASA